MLRNVLLISVCLGFITSPLRANPNVEVKRNSTNDFYITWNGDSEKLYQLFQTNDFKNWLPVGGLRRNWVSGTHIKLINSSPTGSAWKVREYLRSSPVKPKITLLTSLDPVFSGRVNFKVETQIDSQKRGLLTEMIVDGKSVATNNYTFDDKRVHTFTLNTKLYANGRHTLQFRVVDSDEVFEQSSVTTERVTFRVKNLLSAPQWNSRNTSSRFELAFNLNSADPRGFSAARVTITDRQGHVWFDGVKSLPPASLPNAKLQIKPSDLIPPASSPLENPAKKPLKIRIRAEGGQIAPVPLITAASAGPRPPQEANPNDEDEDELNLDYGDEDVVLSEIENLMSGPDPVVPATSGYYNAYYDLMAISPDVSLSDIHDCIAPYDEAKYQWLEPEKRRAYYEYEVNEMLREAWHFEGCINASQNVADIEILLSNAETSLADKRAERAMIAQAMAEVRDDVEEAVENAVVEGQIRGGITACFVALPVKMIATPFLKSVGWGARCLNNAIAQRQAANFFAVSVTKMKKTVTLFTDWMLAGKITPKFHHELVDGQMLLLEGAKGAGGGANPATYLAPAWMVNGAANAAGTICLTGTAGAAGKVGFAMAGATPEALFAAPEAVMEVEAWMLNALEQVDKEIEDLTKQVSQFKDALKEANLNMTDACDPNWGWELSEYGDD